MTKKWFSGRKVRGLSTDSKPTNPEANTEFYETDTKKTFDYTGGAWVERTSGLSGSSNLTLESKTQTLADWVIMQKTKPSSATNVIANTDSNTSCTVTYDLLDTDKVSAVKVDYQLQPSGSWTEATATANDTSHQITGLTSDASYKFRVYPSNIMGEQVATTTGSNQQWVTPTTPQSLTSAQNEPATSILLSWTASTSETGGAVTPITYAVERSLDGSDWSEIANSINTNSYVDSTNSLDTLHYYRVKAENGSAWGSNTSAPSNTTSLSVATDPVTSYGNSIKNEGGGIAGYNTYTYLTTGNSTFVTNDSCTIEVLLVGGGGSGMARWAGGAGGSVVRTNTYTLPAGSYTVGVASSTQPSTFNGIIAKNGGAGNSTNGGNAGGRTGDGGGVMIPTASSTLPSGVTGTIYEGYNGGAGSGAGGGLSYKGGAGGGSNGAGASNGGAGGDGIQITGFEHTDYYYGGGGGGATYYYGGNGGAGGAGGGAGSPSAINGGSSGAGGTGGRNNGGSGTNSAGGTNTGGGGSGGQNGGGGGGGSGIVVIKRTL